MDSLVSLGFTKSDADPNLYYKVVNDEPLILVLYVDNLFLTENESDVDPNLYYKVANDEPLILLLYVHDLFHMM